MSSGPLTNSGNRAWLTTDFRQRPRCTVRIPMESSSGRLPIVNTRYFEAPVPIRLLRHSEFGSEWCELDGMTTGVVFLLRQYDRICERTDDDPLNEVDGTRRIVWQPQFVFECVGPTTGKGIIDGICGAPIVTEAGGVAGFFHQAERPMVFVRCLGYNN